MLKIELEQLSIEELKGMYMREQNKLQQALLDGAEWEKVTALRKLIINIGVVIDWKQDSKNASNYQ